MLGAQYAVAVYLAHRQPHVYAKDKSKVKRQSDQAGVADKWGETYPLIFMSVIEFSGKM